MCNSEKRLIDANALLKKLRKNRKPGYGYATATVGEMPTVDAVEVVHGEWSRLEDDYCGLIALVCSKCNREYWFEDEPPMKIYNYCPNCGAKMDGDGNGN